TACRSRSREFIKIAHHGEGLFDEHFLGRRRNGDSHGLGEHPCPPWKIRMPQSTRLAYLPPRSMGVPEGNYIGTDITGVQALGNIEDGVTLHLFSTNNTIGGTAAGARNVIAANGKNGITVSANASVVVGNSIGTDVSGTLALGNGQAGVFITSSNNTV